MIKLKAFHPIFTLLLLFATYQGNGQEVVSLMSFNIRYDNSHDGENQWNERKSDLCSLINYYRPDFLGIQEGLHHQVQYIREETGYSYTGAGRDDGKQAGEYSAIFYDSTKFVLLKGKTFWLSDTPDDVSTGWDASMERICTYGMFASINSGDTICVFNTHFDHIGETARLKSAELILEKMEDLCGQHISCVLMGDLNCETGSSPVRLLNSIMNDGMFTAMHPFYGPSGTFNAFKTGVVPLSRIDYIFTRNVQVIRYRHIDDCRKNRLWVSDHLPVWAEIRM